MSNSRFARDSDTRDELWFRRHGLPAFVRSDARGHLLIARMVPFLVFAIFADFARYLIDTLDTTLDSGSLVAVGAQFAAMVVVAALLVAVPLGAFRAANPRIMAYPRRMRAVGWGLIAYYVLADPWVVEHPEAGRPIRFPLDATIGCTAIVVVSLLLTWLGVGSLLGWSFATAFKQFSAIGEMTGKVPLMMLVVLFAFFSRALWEVTGAMSVARLAAVAAFIAVLGLLFIVPIVRSELREISAADPPLSRLERANVMTVLILALAAQVAIFAGLVTALLIVLGELAFTPTVTSDWLGTRSQPLELFGSTMPLDLGLAKTAVFLGCIAALNFLVSAASNAAYRSAFFDPLIGAAITAFERRSSYLKTGR